MARQNSTGLPYLVRRPDTGKFIFSRELPPDLVPHVRGDIRLPWSASQARTLDGTARVIKVSLKTGDEATARVRWSHVNGQVEALVQLGRVLAGEQARRGQSEMPVQPVSPEAIAIMAAQARHDLLAEHDRAWIAPNFVSPLTGVIMRLMDKTQTAPTGTTAQVAQHVAQDLLRRDAKRDLMLRRMGVLDRAIVETEVDVDAASYVEALHGGSFASAADMRHDPHSKVVDRVAGEIEARLSENGFDRVSEIDRRTLALALLRTRIGTAGEMQERDAGAAIVTPPRPAVVTPPAPPVEAKPALSAMRALWIADRRPGRKEIDDKSRYVQFFIDLFGDCPVDRITPPMVAEFLSQLERCLRNDPHALRGAPLQERVAWAAKPENTAKPKLKRPTINSKGLGGIAAWLEQARKHGHIKHNPCEGMALQIKPGDVLKRVAYSLRDLKAIFTSGVFNRLDGEFWLRGADHWLPLLGLFTGARLEELGQLLVTDVKIVDGIPCLQITDIPDSTAATTSETEKSIKTPAAHRPVPIHAELIRLGFLDFVEAQRRSGSTRLFPELRRYRGRVTKEWSKSWARFTDKHVTASPSKSFHSLRHLLMARLRAADVNLNLIKALVGHAIDDVTLDYGRSEDDRPFTTELLNKALQSFAVPGLDLTHLYRSATTVGGDQAAI